MSSQDWIRNVFAFQREQIHLFIRPVGTTLDHLAPLIPHLLAYGMILDPFHFVDWTDEILLKRMTTDFQESLLTGSRQLETCCLSLVE